MILVVAEKSVALQILRAGHPRSLPVVQNEVAARNLVRGQPARAISHRQAQVAHEILAHRDDFAVSARGVQEEAAGADVGLAPVPLGALAAQTLDGLVVHLLVLDLQDLGGTAV